MKRNARYAIYDMHDNCIGYIIIEIFGDGCHESNCNDALYQAGKGAYTEFVGYTTASSWKGIKYDSNL